MLDKLGNGGFATVYKCVEIMTNAEFAVKVTAKQKCTQTRYKDKLESEIRIHK